jgi:hypothetical protein
VALSGDATTVVIGADLNSDGGTGAGHARVFRYVSNDWILLGEDIDGSVTYDYVVIASHTAPRRKKKALVTGAFCVDIRRRQCGRNWRAWRSQRRW